MGAFAPQLPARPRPVPKTYEVEKLKVGGKGDRNCGDGTRTLFESFQKLLKILIKSRGIPYELTIKLKYYKIFCLLVVKLWLVQVKER